MQILCIGRFHDKENKLVTTHVFRNRHLLKNQLTEIIKKQGKLEPDFNEKDSNLSDFELTIEDTQKTNACVLIRCSLKFNIKETSAPWKRMNPQRILLTL